MKLHYQAHYSLSFAAFRKPCKTFKYSLAALHKKEEECPSRPEMVTMTMSKQVSVRLCSTSHGQPSVVSLTGQSSKCNTKWFHNNQLHPDGRRGRGSTPPGTSRYTVAERYWLRPVLMAHSEEEKKHTPQGIASLRLFSSSQATFARNQRVITP